ncbi:VOC family protein [Streptosporangium sp. NPDC001681]|uniref:VOC family protein n=1 Tax=Streptosporangium sp. NPDC001681 TaxID=3154395 RepID=UPI0033310CF9
MAKGLLGRLVFATDNCDATFEHIEAAGAEVIQEPINQPDGVRDCAFLDPPAICCDSPSRGRWSWHSRRGRHTPRGAARRPERGCGKGGPAPLVHLCPESLEHLTGKPACVARGSRFGWGLIRPVQAGPQLCGNRALS